MLTKQPEKAFTLIEMVLIIVIIGIVGTIAMKSMQPGIDRSRFEATTREMESLAQAITGDASQIQDGIRTDFGYVGDIGSLPPNLDALATNPGGYSTWDGPYIQSNFVEDADDYKKDAWGDSYTYTGGVTILSNGGGLPITKQFAQSVSDLISNTAKGMIYDGLGCSPGDSALSVIVTIYYPDGAGNITSSSTNPSAAGMFSFPSSIPVGNHLVRAVYSATSDTTSRYVSVAPATDAYCELRFAGGIWSGGS
jgi:type II secretory pathway pseudopilin PulG